MAQTNENLVASDLTSIFHLCFHSVSDLEIQRHGSSEKLYYTPCLFFCRTSTPNVASMTVHPSAYHLHDNALEDGHTSFFGCMSEKFGNLV